MLKTIVIRHAKENKKKCSLTPLEGRSDCTFYTYPQNVSSIPDLSGTILLDFDGPELSAADMDFSHIVVLDGTWRYAKAMRQNIPQLNKCQVRRIPSGFVTAYPRQQTECSDPEAGLASLEAIYVAYRILGADTTGLLDAYYWKDLFMQKNHLKLIASF